MTKKKKATKKKTSRARRTPKVTRADSPTAATFGRDWTVAPDGRSNASDRYLEVVGVVEELLRYSGFQLVNGNVHQVARHIVARLAHLHGFAPSK